MYIHMIYLVFLHHAVFLGSDGRCSTPAKYKTWKKVDGSLTEKYNLLFNTNHKLNMIIDI